MLVERAVEYAVRGLLAALLGIVAAFFAIVSFEQRRSHR